MAAHHCSSLASIATSASCSVSFAMELAESPAAWLKEQEGDGVVDGVVDEMIETAIDEARAEALRMLDILKQDFLA